MAEHISKPHTDGGEPDGAEELDAVADRLEAALTRIAQQLEVPRLTQSGLVDVPRLTQSGSEQKAPQLAARLDGLIERLRDVLGQPRESGQPRERDSAH